MRFKQVIISSEVCFLFIQYWDHAINYDADKQRQMSCVIICFTNWCAKWSSIFILSSVVFAVSLLVQLETFIREYWCFALYFVLCPSFVTWHSEWQKPLLLSRRFLYSETECWAKGRVRALLPLFPGRVRGLLPLSPCSLNQLCVLIIPALQTPGESSGGPTHNHWHTEETTNATNTNFTGLWRPVSDFIDKFETIFKTSNKIAIKH